MIAPRRLTTLVGVMAVLAALLVAATPALAKKPPPPPPPPPTLYEVTISGSLSTGDAGCTAGSALIMRDDGAGNLVADGTGGTSVPRLVFEAAVPWTRLYPVPAGDPTGFHGCHGGALSGDADGYLYLYRDGSTVTGVMWAFDWYKGTVMGPGKHPRPQEVQEYFRTWNVDCLNENTPTFTVYYYGPSGNDEIGTADLTLTITVQPKT
jgi:hypothetical protein